MNFYEAKQAAAHYGAEQPAFGPGSPAAPAWIARIAKLPVADDNDQLQEAVAEANRYSSGNSV
jgi:hypothetical protein